MKLKKAQYLVFVFFPLLFFSQREKVFLDSVLGKKFSFLEEIVLTGTRTHKKKKDAPIAVNVLDSKTLQDLQVCNLSEGLKFQPGLRVETNCQTCNYTQLRMNGLQGGYSQILLNGRPIFSPLMGMYGLEQLPVNMIERIEVVRGGGSSLYGSSAIGGTVNVLTKEPQKNFYELHSFYQNIGNQTSDFNFNGNASLVNEDKNAGVTFFLSQRNRDFFDANQDNFSEIPKIKNTSIGFNSFYKITDNQKLEIAFSNLNEYRLGGEMVNQPAYLRQQAEERKHRIWMGSADYQINFNEGKSSFILYTAFQNTRRNHYTGIFPDLPEDKQRHMEQPPYGNSSNTTWQAGFQINHSISNFFNRRNIFTIGSEYISDHVLDNIPSYSYFVNQHTKNWGTFFQSDWNIAERVNLLSGIRIDQHNFLKNLVVNPRIALLYKYKENTQFRMSYGTGFRAPQAFDTDLHIAFAGGGVSRVQLSNSLQEEKSRSFSSSINYDKPTEKWIAGFTLEAFYTRLNNSFVLENIGKDSVGEIFEKRNGNGAEVKGFTLELRANFSKKIQIETGFTLQKSLFDSPVENIKGLPPTRVFLRTPNDYGYANITFMPNKKWSFNANYVYTGKMQLIHFGSPENNPSDRINTTLPFSELNAKIAYVIPVKDVSSQLELYTGIKNLFNDFQRDFDIGKNRDSNYVYGPVLPRTFFVGLRFFSK